MDVVALSMAWAALVLAPGYGLVRLLAPAAGRWRALALGPAVTLGGTALMSASATAAGVALGRPLAVAVAVGGPVAAILAEGRARRSTGWAGPAPLPWRRERVAVLIGSAVCLLVWALGVVEAAHPPYGDGSNHASFVRRILETGSVDPAQVVLADVPAGLSGAAFYPLTLHVLVAGMVTLTGASIGTALTVVTVLTSAAVLPAGAFLVTRLLFPRRRLARLAAPLLAVVPSAFPYGPWYWGGAVLIVVMALVPGLVEASLTVPGWGRRAAGPVLLGLSFAGVAATHTSEVPLLAGLVLLLLAFRPPSLQHVPRRGVVVPLLLAGAVAALVLLPLLPLLGDGFGERYGTEDVIRQRRDLLPAIATIVLFSHAPVPPWTLWLAATLVGLAAAVWRREALGWVLALVITWCCAILLFVTDAAWVLALTSPWYSVAHRFAYTAYLLAVPLAALGAQVGVDGLRRIVRHLGADPGHRAVQGVVAVLAIALVVPTAVTTVVGLRDATDGSFVGPDDEAAYRWLAGRVSAGERVVNLHYDGSSWMYPDVGVNPVLGMRLYAWDRPEFASRLALVKGADRIGVDPAITRTAQDLDVRYVYWGGDFWPTAPRFMSLDRLQRAPGLREVFRSGSVRVFEVVRG